MSEVKASQAAQIVDVCHVTLWKDVKAGILPARLVGRRGVIHIELDTLRQYAKDNRRTFNEELAQEFTER
jgi:hypothetical protein